MQRQQQRRTQGSMGEARRKLGRQQYLAHLRQGFSIASEPAHCVEQRRERHHLLTANQTMTGANTKQAVVAGGHPNGAAGIGT